VIVTTTPNIEGKKVVKYLGIVTGETIMGANFLKDFAAGLADFFGGRASAYEKELIKAKEIAINEMMERAERLGANAILSVDLDYETVGSNGSMLMVSVSGTAVVVE
jgi:uncharacterized protein YbjQ (UPF0145 family)